jgi:hypothetical protein
MVDLVNQQGFPNQFRNWIAYFLSTSFSWVLLNGIAGSPIWHRRGLWQGDPLLSLPFGLATNLLTLILDNVTCHGQLHELHGRETILRTSLYVDDVAVLVAPIKKDIQNVAAILAGFGEVTGLCTNFQKSNVVPTCYG